MNEDRYYQSSGQFSLMGLIGAVLVASLAILLLAPIYAIVLLYSPLIYINFMGTIFLGAMVGVTVAAAVQMGNIRSAGLKWMLGFYGIFFTLYVHWIVYIWSVTNYEVIILSPVVLFQGLAKLGELGLWSMKDHTPKGWELYSIWLIELGVIGWMTLSGIKDEREPFCEACGTWTNQAENIMIVPTRAELDSLKRDLENEHYEPLFEFDTVEDDHSICQLSLIQCPECEDGPSYLSLSAVTFTTDKEGNTTAEENKFIENLITSPTLIERITAEIIRRAQNAQTPEDTRAPVKGELENTEAAEQAESQ
jgi:hypothetical protein